MSDQPDATRARDVDRIRVRGVLGAAYGDGQLGGGEYHDRLARADAATTLGELTRLTADLWAPEAPAPTSPRFGRRAVLAVAAAAVVAGVLGVAVTRSGGADDPRGGDAVVAATTASPGEAPPAPADPLDADGIAATVALYRHQFGSTTAHELTFYPDTVRVTRRPSDTAPLDVYLLGDAFEPAGTEQAFARTGDVDLALLDADAVADLIAAAPAAVGAAAGAVDHVVVADSGRPTVTVFVSENGRIVGHVVAGPDGTDRHVIHAK